MDSDYIDEHDISSLLSTNRQLIHTKRQRTLKKIQKYADKISHLNRLMCLAKQGKQKDYLKGELGKSLSKKQELEYKIQQIDLIQSEIQKYQDKQNDRTFSENSPMDCLRMLLGLLEHFGVSDAWTNVEKKRLGIKYEGDSNMYNSLDNLIEDIMYLIREGTSKLESKELAETKSREISQIKQQNIMKIKSKQIMTHVNQLLKLYQSDYLVQSQRQIARGIQVLKERSITIGNEFKSNIKKWSNELTNKQKQFELEEGKVCELKKLRKSVEKDIEADSKKLERLKQNLEEQEKKFNVKQANLKKMVEQQHKLQQKQHKNIQNQEHRKQKLESEKQKLKHQISKRSIELRQLQDNINSQINTKQNKLTKLSNYIAQLKQQKNKLKIENQQMKEKILRKNKQLSKLEQQYRINQAEFYKSKECMIEIKRDEGELREKYEEFMASVLESKKQYEELIIESEDLNNRIEKGQNQKERLNIQKEQIVQFIRIKNNELFELNKQIEQFHAHKVEMEQQFEQIEQRKKTIFGAILEKQQYNHKLQETKNNLQHRINTLEHQSMKYNRLFKEYNQTIEGITQKIQKLKNEEKIIASNIDQLQEEQNQTVRRVQKLEKVEIREGLRSLPESSTKDGIARIMNKVENYEALEKKLKETEAEVRRLRLENQNIKVLQA